MDKTQIIQSTTGLIKHYHVCEEVFLEIADELTTEAMLELLMEKYDEADILEEVSNFMLKLTLKQNEANEDLANNYAEDLAERNSEYINEIRKSVR